MSIYNFTNFVSKKCPMFNALIRTVCNNLALTRINGISISLENADTETRK